MCSKTIGYLLLLMFASMGLLVVITTAAYFTCCPIDQILPKSRVLGMAALHGESLYTLSFDQQTQALDILNRSHKIENKNDISDKSENFGHNKLIIYLSDGKEISIAPISNDDQTLYFKTPFINANAQLTESVPGELNSFLTNIFLK